MSYTVSCTEGEWRITNDVSSTLRLDIGFLYRDPRIDPDESFDNNFGGISDVPPGQAVLIPDAVQFLVVREAEPILYVRSDVCAATTTTSTSVAVGEPPVPSTIVAEPVTSTETAVTAPWPDPVGELPATGADPFALVTIAVILVWVGRRLIRFHS